MKNYFKYTSIMGVYGINAINLKGTLEDWKKINNKFEYFHSIPIIDKIIETKIYYSKNKDINDNLRNFWKDLIRVKNDGEYQPDIIDGWIIKFLPDFNEIASGFYGIIQDEKNFGIKPVIGYAIVVEDKKFI